MIYKTVEEIPENQLAAFHDLAGHPDEAMSGICGFDGFIDHFIRMESPDRMEDFATCVSKAAGVSASYRAKHLGAKFGGNGPLFVTALHGIENGKIDLSYIGALGKDGVLPIFKEAMDDKIQRLYSLAEPAHTNCLEFRDGKIMLNDSQSCDDIHWDRLIACIGAEQFDALLQKASFVAAVNWGKLNNVSSIWENIIVRLKALNSPAKDVVFFMDIAEFEHRSSEDVKGLLKLIERISDQCETILSLNLKEGWQLAEVFESGIERAKSPEPVAETASIIHKHLNVDRVLIHPNDGAACASKNGVSYVPGPFCQDPLISTGAGDHFGAGALAGALHKLDDVGILLNGVAASGYFVRSGHSPNYSQMSQMLQMWKGGTLGDRID